MQAMTSSWEVAVVWDVQESKSEVLGQVQWLERYK
jgi:hypothetical protein